MSIEEKSTKKLSHNLILKERNQLNISGVLDVDSFDEHMVIAYTELGELTIGGENLHISKINLDSGDVILDGEISSLTYTQNSSKKQSLFSKLFR